MEVMRWVLVGIIGILTGIVAFLINISVKYLFKLKFDFFNRSKQFISFLIRDYFVHLPIMLQSTMSQKIMEVSYLAF